MRAPVADEASIPKIPFGPLSFKQFVSNSNTLALADKSMIIYDWFQKLKPKVLLALQSGVGKTIVLVYRRAGARLFLCCLILES
jgi:hypothetical protein